jgi:2-deoxy-D-gluconate 3-dehydrogenase
MKLFDLTGKVALVTGGNGGIGLGLAEGMASCGATIAISGRNAEKARAALATLRAHGVKSAFRAADITKKSECQALVAATEAEFGRIDILVNNAGTAIRKMPQDYTEAEWHEVLDTNLTSAFLLSQAVYPAMKRAGAGKIINIGSMMSIFGASFAPAYAASKGGIVQLTRSLASAWAPDNIQANAVLPGWIDTDLTRVAREQIPGLHDNVLRRTPAARWGVIDDLAGVAVFLASPASDFISGAAIPVDGGYSIQG